MGHRPWGIGCNQPVLNPRPPPAPPCVAVTVTSTVTTATTTTSHGINPATAAAATGVCMGLTPPGATPLFDAGGNPACCVLIFGPGGTRVC
ncbi:hypothetical protein N658DRAFT_524533 [Parathielavia hyrcaniae]|uniref:Uncharacterized protein n=1 Tax=Parathielavia hyrcaniae TaxID=113614 RepID=A0AAN6PZ73_9PEZI|nr:hypothetical protein N658DRAFT_524533 [Parathielavia hyrcaniae]